MDVNPNPENDPNFLEKYAEVKRLESLGSPATPEQTDNILSNILEKYVVLTKEDSYQYLSILKKMCFYISDKDLFRSKLLSAHDSDSLAEDLKIEVKAEEKPFNYYIVTITHEGETKSWIHEDIYQEEINRGEKAPHDYLALPSLTYLFNRSKNVRKES